MRIAEARIDPGRPRTMFISFNINMIKLIFLNEAQASECIGSTLPSATATILGNRLRGEEEMKRYVLTISCLVLAVAFTQGSTRAEHPNVDYSGKWVFNASKSSDIPPQMPGFRVFNKTVTQNQQLDQLTVWTDFMLEHYTPDPNNPIGHLPITIREVTFDLNGKETRVAAGPGFSPAAVLSAKWIGQDLELTQQIIRFESTGELGRKVTELWELVEDGKVLKIHQTIETVMHTKQSSVFAFDKN